MDLKSLVNENQSIKIVPSIEDIIRQNGFNTDLDPNTVVRFSHLKVTWQTWKRSALVKSELYEIFNTVPDPFSVALIMVVKCDDFKDAKPKTLPYCIVEEIDTWKRTYCKNPGNNLKLTAFHIATKQRNQDFLNLIVKSYNIKSENKAVLPLVQDMIKQGVYKQALQCVMSMEMYDYIPVEDLLFPLVLQDKGSMVDAYLMQCPQKAKPMILYIDKLLDRKCSLRETLQNYVYEHDIIDVKWEKLYHKPLGKLVARLCAKFTIPLQDCKNLSKNRTTGGLRYLIGQKYQEKNVSDSAWHDLVKDTLEKTPEAAEEFVDMLIEYDIKEAKKWAELLKIPEEQYPPALSSVATTSVSDKSIEDENWESEAGVSESSQNYHKLSLGKENVFIIDNNDKFYNLMNATLKNMQIVGVDSEWKPSFGASQSRVALIQVATTDNVYLIDLTVMNNEDYTIVWQAFLNNVIDNAELIKVGFGLEHDIREMKNTFLSMGNLKMKGEGFLDLSKLWKGLAKAGLRLPHNNEDSGGSLSWLTQACFGLPLMKHEQCSNWEIRPLRPSQIDYAALDAYVLVEIYTLLQNLCQQQNIKFDEICYDIMAEENQKSAKKTRPVKRVDIPVNISHLKKTVESVKFLLESDVHAVIPFLRFCGIDCVLISIDMLWHNVVNLAISEDRYIILSKLKYTPTVNYSQNNIYQVRQGDEKHQLIEILDHFQVKITPENLFTRCVLCNGIDLSTVSYNDIQQMYAAYRKSEYTAYKLYARHNDYDGHLDADQFLSDEDSDEELYQQVNVDFKDDKQLLTKKGATMKLEEVSRLPTGFSDPIMLCQDCGKFYWNGNHPINDAGSLINDLPLC